MAVLAAHQFGLSWSSTHLSRDQLCRALLSTGTQVPAETWFRQLRKAKGHVGVCSGADGAGAWGYPLQEGCTDVSIAREEGVL